MSDLMTEALLASSEPVADLRLERAISIIQQLAEALRFYRDAYSVSVVYHNYPEERSHSVIEDDGKVAREALTAAEPYLPKLTT